MEKRNKEIDPLPEEFATEEEAGEFWDTHTTIDYIEYLEPTDDVIDIQKRVYEVQVEEDVFQRLQQEARLLRQPIPAVVNQILRKTFAIA